MEYYEISRVKKKFKLRFLKIVETLLKWKLFYSSFVNIVNNF